MRDIYSFIGEPKPFDENDLNEMVYNLMEVNIPLSPTNKYKIYIPSKGRATLNKTTTTLDGLNFMLVVEPQDYDAYRKVYPEDQLLQLDRNDQGIAYVRNYIKKYSRSVGEEKHWQMDDDINSFKIRKRGTTKNIIVDPMLCISIVEHCMDMFTNIAISGISSSTYAFSKTRAVQKNKLAYQVVLLDNAVNIEYAPVLAAEDWDYTLKVLEAGYCTLVFHHIMNDSSSTMKNSGGCTDIAYVGDKRKLSYENFIKLWPGRFVVKAYPNTKIPWRLRHTRQFLNDYKQQLILKIHETLNH